MCPRSVEINKSQGINNLRFAWNSEFEMKRVVDTGNGCGTLMRYIYNSVPVHLEIIIDKITHPGKGMTLGAIVDAHVERLYINNELSRDVTVANVILDEDQQGCVVILSDATTIQIDWDFADQYGHWEDLPTFH